MVWSACATMTVFCLDNFHLNVFQTIADTPISYVNEQHGTSHIQSNEYVSLTWKLLGSPLRRLDSLTFYNLAGILLETGWNRAASCRTSRKRAIFTHHN